MVYLLPGCNKKQLIEHDPSCLSVDQRRKLSPDRFTQRLTFKQAYNLNHKLWTLYASVFVLCAHSYDWNIVLLSFWISSCYFDAPIFQEPVTSSACSVCVLGPSKTHHAVLHERRLLSSLLIRHYSTLNADWLLLWSDATVLSLLILLKLHFQLLQLIDSLCSHVMTAVDAGKRCAACNKTFLTVISRIM